MRDLASSAPANAPRLRSHRLDEGQAPHVDDEKIKLRWSYVPQEGGPRFEIGSYGSRKGAMKRKLVHVAMDWAF